MTIIPRKAVLDAVARALTLGPGDTEAAIAVAAQALGLPVEAVRECLPAAETAACPCA